MSEPWEPAVKTRRGWGEGRKIRYIARLFFTDETILTMAKFCSKWVPISVKFQELISEESIWQASLTLKAFMMRHDKKGAQKVINEGPRLQISRTLEF